MFGAENTATLIFFVPPHSLVSALSDFTTLFGGSRRCVVARELTKVGCLPACLSSPAPCQGFAVLTLRIIEAAYLRPIIKLPLGYYGLYRLP